MISRFPFPADPGAPDIKLRFKSLLFLDIDGVLHPCIYQARLLCHLPLLTDWLEHNPHVGVVVASSWRQEGPDFLAAELSPIADRLLGWTATDDNPVASTEFDADRGGRGTLARTWMEQHDWLGCPAAALDDMDDLYPSEFGVVLVATDPAVGLTSANLGRLTDLLRPTPQERRAPPIV